MKRLLFVAIILQLGLIPAAAVPGDQTRQISALNVNSTTTWTDEANAYVEDDQYAYTSNLGSEGEYGGGNFQDPSEVPDLLTDFKVRFYDRNADQSNDVVTLDVYNPHTTAWETLETFDTGNYLPTSLTTKDYTTAMQSKFAAASEKQAFLNGLQLRFCLADKVQGADGISIALAWANFTYDHSSYHPENDTNCRAWWRMETGAITTDSSGESNTLSDYGSVAVDGTYYKEGSYSADFTAGASQYLYRADADLSSDFPLKSGDATKDISIAFWFRPDDMPGASATDYIWAKYDTGNDKRSVAVVLNNSSGVYKFAAFCGHTSGTASEIIWFGTVCVVDVWYHITFTHEGSSGNYRLRIWDDNASDQLGSDVTGTLANALTVSDAEVDIGTRADHTNFTDGYIDDVLVFDDVLTVGEIDQIRAQTYDPGAGESFVGLLKQTLNNPVLHGDTLTGGLYE